MVAFVLRAGKEPRDDKYLHETKLLYLSLLQLLLLRAVLIVSRVVLVLLVIVLKPHRVRVAFFEKEPS